MRNRSMEPTLYDGDRLLVRYDGTPAAGRLAIVRLPPEADGTPRPVAVKRLSRPDEGGWWVIRDNPAMGVDSSQVGPVSPPDVLAVVLLRLWPRPGLLRGHPGGTPDAPAKPRG